MFPLPVGSKATSSMSQSSARDSIISSHFGMPPFHGNMKCKPDIGSETERMQGEVKLEGSISEFSNSGMYREFCCATMMRLLFHDSVTTKDNLAPFSQPLFAAVLFADISGFTRLSASLNAEDLKKRIK